MTETEIRLKELARKVGENSAYDFQLTVELATDEFYENVLENTFVSDETKVDYITYVFATILDRIIEQDKLKHLN